MHIALTAAVIAPVTAIAMLTTKLTTVIAVGGAFTAPCLCYVIPGSVFLKAKRMHDESGYDSEDDLQGGVEDGLGQNLLQTQKMANSTLTSGYIMLAFGGCVQVLCITGAFWAVV